MPTGYDVVIIPLHKIEAPSFSKVYDELRNAVIENDKFIS
jgi:hypothetical protein